MTTLLDAVAEEVDRVAFHAGVNTYQQSRSIAKAAIRATLEHARDNVKYESAERVHKLLACWDLSVADVTEGIEVYFTALLAELDRETKG